MGVTLNIKASRAKSIYVCISWILVYMRAIHYTDVLCLATLQIYTYKGRKIAVSTGKIHSVMVFYTMKYTAATAVYMPRCIICPRAMIVKCS